MHLSQKVNTDSRYFIACLYSMCSFLRDNRFVIAGIMETLPANFAENIRKVHTELPDDVEVIILLS